MNDDKWKSGYVTLFTQLCQTADSAVIEFDNMELRTPQRVRELLQAHFKRDAVCSDHLALHSLK